MSDSSQSNTNEHMDAFKQWCATVREDVDTLKGIVAAETIDRRARMFAAAGLNYLISRMDLVPDWEESVGLIDDLMVLRLCIEAASQHKLDETLEEPAHIVAVGRLLNDGQRITDFLGRELAKALREHCARLIDTAVRGRSCSIIVDNSSERSRLFEEVEKDLERMPTPTFADPEMLAVKLKSYLAHKLKN